MSVDLLVIHCISLPLHYKGSELVHALFSNTLKDKLGEPQYQGEAFQQLLRTDSGLWDEKGDQIKLSAHFLIDKMGAVTQYVATGRAAFHAGPSKFEDRENCNDFSIGVELLGEVGKKFSEKQYVGLVSLTRCLMECYPEITEQRLTCHSDIDTRPVKKEDPGPGFKRDYFKSLLRREPPSLA